MTDKFAAFCRAIWRRHHSRRCSRLVGCLNAGMMFLPIPRPTRFGARRPCLALIVPLPHHTRLGPGYHARQGWFGRALTNVVTLLLVYPAFFIARTSRS